MKQENETRVRVTAVYRDKCLLAFPEGERTAEVTGRFRYEAESRSEFPAVGDWVLASVAGPDLALIHSILPRRSVLARKVAGKTTEAQVLAANVECAFIVTSFNEDFNLRRLERYLAMIKEADVEPVILVNKSDLAQPEDNRLAQAGGVAIGVDVLRVSAWTGEGVDSIDDRLKQGLTGVFLGSSGVGKSSLLNRLLGREIQETQTVRMSDSHGRHTTTARQMFALPSGGFVIDTPGLREIGLWGSDSVLEDVYADVARLAQECRFRDCRHQGEADCAVAHALESGKIDAGRWAGYVKLQKELAYLKRKKDPEQQANTKKRWKKIHKSIRGHIKRKRDPYGDA